ncbi:FtsX-like permease family protein, partial [Aegicerativicinus sediminis]
EKQNNHWQNFSFQTFIKYSNQIALEDLDTKINEVYVQTHLQKKGSDYEKYMASPTSETLFSERFTDLHTNPKSGDSNLPVINILLILAASLLLAGAINFSNLSLAASISKAKEIGVRKILGSANLQLFWKFFMDIFFQIILSVIIATLLVVLMLPWFKTVFNISFNLLQGSLLWVFAQILCILLAVATLSGLYPSIVASRYNPIQVLKGQTKQKVGSMGLRNVLIIGQFVLSGFFIVCSVVIYKQVSFMQDKDKGFNDEQVIRIQTTQNTREQNFDLTREKLMAIAGISSVSKTTTVPGDKYIDTTSNRLLWDAKTLRFNEVKISTDYFKTLDAKLISGRWLDNRYNDQHTRSTIINETAAKQMGLENPIGQVLRFQHCDSVPIEIVGVIKDFQVEGVNRPIQSTMFLIGNEACSYLSGGAIIARLSSGNPKNTLAQIENVWKTIEPDFPMRYSFLNENFQKLYAEYLRIQKVVGYFTIVALLIAVMGLFALSAFLIKQRTKELGIRKVLGASALDIFKAVSGRFILYVTIATAIAIPLGWIASSRWLQNFAYKYEINWLIFIASASILLITAIITVGLQAVKAMRENPILSLRNE